ncbi:hypothetical protein HGRIS_005531 [Hohenbuehelia grisea]|uniref:DUF6534 domain-containing protein n=1 Tax=Hohenbuehelia grisea TaxID=104357 RepID=A0ABR3JZG1_9AGAR
MPGVELVFGPMLIGVFLNTILYGVLALQTFIYYQTYKRDKAWIRYFVLYLFVLETANTGFDIGMMYEPLVVRYGTPRATTRVPIMLSLDPIVTVLISTPVQLFIAWRIKIISKSKVITAAIVFFAVCAFVGGVATTVCVTVIPEYARLQEFHAAVITWLASSAAADVVITGSLVYSLYNRKTGLRATDDVINRIIRLTVQTGMITAISAGADVIIFLAVPSTTLNFIWDFALSKLYTNSLLSTLNARAGWDHLTGDANQPNVLFGDDSSASMTRSDRTPRKDRSNRQVITTGVYELEPHSMSAHESGKSDRDVEFGVAVSKVVERLEDPIPGGKPTQ